MLGQLNIVRSSLPSVVETIEVRSAFSPPVTIDVRKAVSGGKQTGRGSQFGPLTKPTVILRGPVVGTQTIAPYGRVDPNVWRLNLTVAGAAVALAGGLLLLSTFGAGRLRERRKRR